MQCSERQSKGEAVPAVGHLDCHTDRQVEGGRTAAHPIAAQTGLPWAQVTPHLPQGQGWFQLARQWWGCAPSATRTAVINLLLHQSPVRPLILSSINSFIHPFSRLFIHSFVQSFVCCKHACIHSFIHSSNPFIHASIHASTYSLCIHSLNTCLPLGSACSLE